MCFGVYVLPECLLRCAVSLPAAHLSLLSRFSYFVSWSMVSLCFGFLFWAFLKSLFELCLHALTLHMPDLEIET